MTNNTNFFINNPIFVKFKKRFDFITLRSVPVLKSVHINERIVEIPFAIQAVSQLPKGTKVLDLGCTESPLPLQLATLGYRVTGFDFRTYPYAHPNLTFVQGDMTKLPFDNESFDVVLSISTLEHIGIGFYKDPKEIDDADKKALSEAVRVLKHNGLFILTAPYGIANRTDQQRIYDEKNLAELLSPLNIETIRYFKSHQLDQSAGNAWIEINQTDADAIVSPNATTCVCLVRAKKQ